MKYKVGQKVRFTHADFCDGHSEEGTILSADGLVNGGCLYEIDFDMDAYFGDDAGSFALVFEDEILEVLS
jgi:hypothetical protein